MSLSSSAAPVSSVSWRRDLLWLALVFAIFFGFRLGSYPLANPDEGRNTEIAREMVASGDWVTPRLNGVNYFEKPPLVYWALAVNLKLFGRSEWSMRAVPALFALAGVLLTYAAARRLHGRDAGWWAAIVLGTSLLYFGTGRFLVLDMPVSVLMSATLFCFILGIGEPPGARRRWLFYGLYASAALATLTKGGIGFLVTGAVMFFWLLIFNQWKKLLPLYLPTGIVIFLVIALPWHLLAHERNETWAHRYLYFEHWARFTTTAHGRAQPWYYFIGILIAGFFPWTVFLFQATRDALRGGWRARGDHPVAWFLVTWAAFIFLFFSKSQSKLPAYILPIFPALAVLVGAWMARILREEDGTVRAWIGLRAFSFSARLLALVLVVAVLKVGWIIRDPAQAQALLVPAIVLAAVLAIGATIAPGFARAKGARVGLGVMVGTMAIFLAGLSYAAVNIQKPGTKALAYLVKAEAKPGDRVMHYFDFFHDFTFYAGRVVDVVAAKSELELEEDAAARASGRFIDEATFRQRWTQPGRIFVVAKKRDVERRGDGRPPLFLDPTFHYHLLAQTQDHYLFSNQP